MTNRNKKNITNLLSVDYLTACSDCEYSTQWGIHVTKWLGAQSLLLVLTPLQVRFFRISRFIPDGIFSNEAQSTRKLKLFLVVSVLFCNLVWFSRTFGEYFRHVNCQVTQIDSKNILRIFSRIRPDRRIVLTPPERAWFSAYSALYLNKFHSAWIDIY